MDDLKLALRSMLRNPSFAFIATLTLALGIGANTAIFSVVNGVLLRPLPYDDPDRIVALFQSNRQSGDGREAISPANFMDWKERSKSFEYMAAFSPGGMDLAGDGHPETIPSTEVTVGFFEALGATPLHGRVFQPAEYEPGKNRVVIFSHLFWQQRFGGDPSIVGRTVRLDDVPYVVVGVMRDEFALTARLWDSDGREARRAVWTPDTFDPRHLSNRRAQTVRAIARLRPGVTPAEAQAEMDTITAALAREYPQANLNMGATVLPVRETLVGGVRKLILIVFGAVAMVLLIACANIANLLLARSTTRQRELAVRVALGASRWRLFRMMLTEGLILALAGGAAGMALAAAGTRAIVAMAPPGLPRVEEIAVDTRVALFAFAATFIAALLFSAFPAVHFSRTKAEGERAGTATGSVHALRNSIVAVEIALALVLLTGAGLLGRSFVSLLQVDPGFKYDNLIQVQLFIWDRYDSAAKRIEFLSQATERLKALPGVTSAGAATAVPFASVSIDFDVNFLITGRPAPPPDDEPAGYFTVASAGYFETIGMPLRAGRIFTADDNLRSKRVAVISESLAKKYWPNENPIGREIEVRYGKLHKREIVGIVSDVRHSGLDAEARPTLFVPHAQYGDGGFTLLVRTSTDPALLIKPVQEALWAMNPALPIYSAETASALVAESLAQRRFVLMLLGAFSAVALILATIGIYGVITYTTAQRTREIGIRSALGAGRADLLRLVLGQGFRIAAAGVAAGIAGALLLTRFLRGMLYGVAHTDPLTFTLTALLLVFTALAAAYVPARRAAGLDPAIALRYE